MVRESGIRRPFFLRSSENGSSPIFCFQANDGPLKGYLRAARWKRISEAPLPSTVLKRSSDLFVFSVLYRDPVQAEEITARGDDLPRKLDRRALLGPRAKQNA